MRKRSTFGSKFGTIAVVGGSVIGLGNIWRFPYVAGDNGGAAFILIYIVVSFLISVPLMITEFSIGRSAQRNSMRAFRKLTSHKRWGLLGFIGIASALLILSFYSVIAGWAMEYLFESFKGSYLSLGSEQITQNFNSFIASGWRSVIWTLLFVTCTAVIVSFGIEKGIERYNKLLMPVMFMIIVGMVVNSFFMPGFREAAAFLMTPDFSKITGKVWLEALGQSFFSMSIGLGAMVTYGSYISKRENLFKVAGTVAISDLTVAVLSGLAIFPAVFSYGISPTSGPELVFLTLPNIFAQMPGGYVVSILFFFLLCGAAITSTISLVEVLTAFVSEEFRLKRRSAIGVVVATVAMLSTICALSQMPDSQLKIGGMNIFDIFDHATSNYMLPIGGMLTAIFAGWIVNRTLLKNEMTTNGSFGVRIFSFVFKLVKYIIPIVIAILFLSKIGLLKLS